MSTGRTSSWSASSSFVGGDRRDADGEHEHRDRDREDAVAERADPVEVATLLDLTRHAVRKSGNEAETADLVALGDELLGRDPDLLCREVVVLDALDDRPASPVLRTGNPNCRPSGVPYSPRLATASECQSPSGVGRQTLFTESIAACAADAADDEPRASITAAPRFCTVSMNGPCSHASSPITSGAGLPPIPAWAKSGNCVAEWLPQIARFVTSRTAHAGLLRELGLGPVLVEPGHREPAVGGDVGRVAAGDQAVGVARVADDEHAHVARRRAR